ncbi:hypothetical protein [Nocardia sp. XZ_19_231]|uniref:hypothetical protein n=1 Tax=Nocardia sp. XZ_19_231 TaxID=2769252 RepID=UPI0018909B24|nr:hypothetical protein [Nocardia sp. XZ_19_231]
MTALGFAIAIGLPLIVLFGTIVWPEPIPQDRTVHAIRARIESEREGRRGHRHPQPW